MKKEIFEKAFAKLNISLDVGRKRPDGYHDMTMIMQAVSLCDDVYISLDDSGLCSCSSGLSYLPSDERNLAVKAAKLYLEAIEDSSTGAMITLDKRIPVGAGMAGGSSDAAAVLRGMNTLFDGRLSREQLLGIAEKVGSDVAFCLLCGTALAEGRGEILSPLPDFPECSLVICKPAFSVSTPELFRKIDAVRFTGHPDTKGIIEALGTGDLKSICRRMYNVFETVDDRRMRNIADIKSRLMDEGAEGAIMTGTGSAVFGVFTDAAAAEKAAAVMKKELPFSVVAVPVGSML